MEPETLKSISTACSRNGWHRGSDFSTRENIIYRSGGCAKFLRSVKEKGESELKRRIKRALARS